MNDEPAVAAALRRAMNAETQGHRLDPGVASTAWVAAHATRPRRIRTGLAVAASVIAVAGGAAAVALTADHQRNTTPPSGSSACTGTISTATLPTWARSGFSADALHTQHVLGAHGEIIGVLFGELRAHQPPGTNNKILWIAKSGSGPLNISARLEGSGTTATRTVDLGPSTIDVPAPGCWQMTVTWPGHSDTIAFRYR